MFATIRNALARSWQQLWEAPLWALIGKEINQIRKSRQTLFFLLFPPTIQLVIYGLALNPVVTQLPIGVLDQSQTLHSRELVAVMTQTEVFRLQSLSPSVEDLGQQVATGRVTAGVVIPPDFARALRREQPAQVQIWLDGVNANTAGIAAGYFRQIFNQFNRQLLPNPPPVPVDLETRFLYNPGLLSSWFFVPGMIGVVLTLTSSLISATTVVREKDTGTLEQLLMTPASGWEILVAKIVPLFVLMMGDVFLALGVARLVFRVPFRGDLGVFLLLAGLYLFIGIGLGILLATLASSQQQAVLTSFFINLPIIQLSGAIAPIESMPVFFQYCALLDPLRHFITIVRGILLKGIGLDVLWPHALALLGFAVVIMAVSVDRFRQQLG
ncbi:MAG: ABC transporter permease [Cyanobacteriota bacterium]